MELKLDLYVLRGGGDGKTRGYVEIYNETITEGDLLEYMRVRMLDRNDNVVVESISITKINM